MVSRVTRILRMKQIDSQCTDHSERNKWPKPVNSKWHWRRPICVKSSLARSLSLFRYFVSFCFHGLSCAGHTACKDFGVNLSEREKAICNLNLAASRQESSRANKQETRRQVRSSLKFALSLAILHTHTNRQMQSGQPVCLSVCLSLSLSSVHFWSY